MGHARRLVKCVLMAAALCAPRAVCAAGQAVQLAYKYHLGEPLTYSLRVEGNGRVSSSQAGAQALTVSPIHSLLAAEFVLTPIEELEDGTYRVAARVTRFAHQVSLPDLGSDLRVYMRGDTLVLARNGEESMLSLPSAEVGAATASVPDASPELAHLARLVSRPIYLRASPNGETRIEPDPNSGVVLPGLAGAISLGAYPRFVNTPVRVQQSWSVEIPMVIPGVSATTITANLALEGTEFVDNYRWATVSVRGNASAEMLDQPIFGCRDRFRLDELNQQLTGTFVFAVDQGRTVRQEMDMCLAMSVLMLSPDGTPVGKIQVDMEVKSLLELAPAKGPPPWVTAPPDFVTP